MTHNQSTSMSRAKIIITNIISIPFLVIFLGVLLFLPAGNIGWINGWILIASLIIYLLFTSTYFLIKDPSTLEKRSKLSNVKGDNLILALFGLLFLTMLILSAFDFRYSWSQVPISISIAGLSGLIISYLILFLVMKENSFASKGLRIHEDQKLITTGPYSFVRHPLYFGGTIMGFCIPLTLGSFYGLVPAIILPFIYIIRIRTEEKMLINELKGYTEYRQTVKYKLIPGIW